MTDMRKNNVLTARQVADLLKATLAGDGELSVSGVNVIERARPHELAFVGCDKNLKRVADSEALVIIAPPSAAERVADYPEKTFVLVSEPEMAYLQVSRELVPERPRSQIGISPLAVVAETAQIGSRTNIHPHAIIGENVSIGEHCDIGSGAVIGDGCVLGDDVVLDPNVVLYPDTTLGNQIHIQAGSVLGGDGFGYRTVDGRHERLPHVGTVRICDDVQIGACSTVDRAKSGETVIGSGTRIDNLVVIAHNCQIGEHNLLVSQTGIAGSSSTGSYVVCAGQAGIADHVHLGDHAIIGAKSGVHRDMPGGKSYLGNPAEEAGTQARALIALRRLPQMRNTVKTLEKQVAELQEQVQQLLSLAKDSGASGKAA